MADSKRKTVSIKISEAAFAAIDRQQSAAKQAGLRKLTQDEIVDRWLAASTAASSVPGSAPDRNLIESLAQLHSKSAEFAKAALDIAKQIESVHADAEAFARSAIEAVRSRGKAKEAREAVERSKAGN